MKIAGRHTNGKGDGIIDVKDLGYQTGTPY